MGFEEGKEELVCFESIRIPLIESNMAPLVRRNVGQKCRALNNKALAASNVARTTAARNAPEKAAGARRSLQKQHKFVKPTVADTR